MSLFFINFVKNYYSMTPKKRSYFKVFGLFLLLVGCGGAIVSLVNRYLRTNDFASNTTTYILWLCLTVYFFFVCRWLFRKLNALEKNSK